MFIHYSFKLFIHMNLSDPFHIIIEIRQGEVLTPCLFTVYLDDLSQGWGTCHP